MHRGAGLRHVASTSAGGVKSSCSHRRPYASRRSAPLPRPMRPHTPHGPQKFHVPSQAIPWVFSSILAGAMGLYGAELYVSATQPCRNPAIKELAGQKDVSGRYVETADSFDGEVGLSEVLMGVNRIRKTLAQQATGHVLEVSCGTGRNIGYFDLGKDSRVESLTFVDLAPQMVNVCKKKWQVLIGKSDILKHGLTVRFLPASALGQMPLAPSIEPTKKYDTIFQTMGLCSTASPVDLIVNMTRHLDLSNPDARILLLEHGRSYQEWVNNILDGSAEKHAEIHGCWFNRDIGALVEQAAAQSGLVIVNERRYHFGTTWVFELKPTIETVEQRRALEKSPGKEEKTSKWFSWSK